MAWDTSKSPGDRILSADWNAMVADQKDRVDEDGTVPLTGNWDAGDFEIRAKTFQSDIATGTAPFIVASTTVVANLNADQVDGHDLDQDVLIASDVEFASVLLTNTLKGTPDAITATSHGVAASVNTFDTEVTTDGDEGLDNVTLAAGVDGQQKNIYCVAVGHANDTWKITPASLIGYGQITFTGAGQGCTLKYDSGVGGWIVIGDNGGTLGQVGKSHVKSSLNMRQVARAHVRTSLNLA